MLRTYGIQNKVLRELNGDESDLENRLKQADWIDLLEPDDLERELVDQVYPSALPDADDVEEIEASARYYSEGSDLHVHSLFLYQSEGRHRTATVAVILRPDCLLTFRDVDLPDFRLMRMRARRGRVDASTSLTVLTSLFEQKVENLADVLEDVHRDLEEVSHMVLEDEDAELEEAIDRLARIEDSSGKIRLCLMDTQRSISFMQRHLRNNPEEQESCREMLRDLDTLMSHTAFTFEKVNFLMDAALGFINLEQNQIIKIFSIAAVVFLPPTLIASIYGMNFEHMPELHWTYSYPIALVMMVLSGIAPYWFFKRKGWL